MKNKYFQLAELLFDLELERLSNDTEEHFQWNGWLDNFGSKSVQFVDSLTSKEKEVKGLARLLKQDFDNKVWEDKEDGLYDYMMPSYYDEYISNCLERQLAVITKIGYQSEISFN
jgi:hypothetical protein